MTRKYTKYGAEHIDIIRPFIILNIINRVPVKCIADKLDMSYDTLAKMMYKNDIRVINVRRGHEANQNEWHNRVGEKG